MGDKERFDERIELKYTRPTRQHRCDTKTESGRADLEARELINKLRSDFCQVVQHVLGASPHRCGRVLDAMLGTQWLHHAAKLAEVVARDVREQVMLHLQVQATHEPADNPRAMHVAGRSDLPLVVLGRLVSIVRGHAIVAKSEGDGKHQAAHHLRGQEENYRLHWGHVQHHQRQVPSIVRQKTNVLPNAQPERLVMLELLVPWRLEAEHEREGLHEPADAGDEQDGEVQEGLVLDEESANRASVHSATGHLLAPGKQWHRVNVGIAVVGTLLGFVHVRDGVVGVVLVLPPLHAETLPHVADDQAEDVAPQAVVEHLVVAEVVCQPPTLLPEKSNEERTQHEHGHGALRVRNTGGTQGPDHHVGGNFPHVVHPTAVRTSWRR